MNEPVSQGAVKSNQSEETVPASARAPEILLTGATGYIGGRLLKALEEAGRHVRCLARNPQFLQSRADHTTEVVRGDVLDKRSLKAAMVGIQTAYYLIHSMGASTSFEETDRQAARNFARAAAEAGVQRIIYLGGLGDSHTQLSAHLRSRQEVGNILGGSGVPTLEFRASIIVGSGSLSFEMIRALVERLPVMIMPRWVLVPAQPIAIADVVDYLVAAREVQVLVQGHHIFEIGGPDRVSYADLMREYARARGLKRLMVPVPVLTPWLSSLWLGLVTPLYARIGRKLIESIRHPTVVQDESALQVFAIRPKGVTEAIQHALQNEERAFALTHWSDAVASGGMQACWGGIRFGNRLVDSRTVSLDVPPPLAFGPIRRIGGATGWYYGNVLWQLRGFIDRMVGGVGLRRGRRNPEWLRAGDAVDFWRVEAFEPERRLCLVAEMKLPGRAWLEFELTGNNTSSTICQTAIFEPAGLTGLVYWYGLYPLHQWIFAGMLRGIVSAVRPAQEAGGN